MVQRHYSSNARETTLTLPINNAVTSIQVDTPIGYPSTTPFIIHVELGTSNEEIMLVTNVLGPNWTVTRGYDGSSALSHGVGAKVVHGVSAVDFEDAGSHINASGNVHGLGASSLVVGTTDTQTLTNKTLTSPSIAGGALSGAFTGNLTTSGNVSATALTASGALTGGTLTVASQQWSEGAWTNYASSWTSTGTAPVLGNGTLSARYARFGKTIVLNIVLGIGTTTTPGTGTYSLSLPFPSSANAVTAMGVAQFNGATRWGGQVLVSPGASVFNAFFASLSPAIAPWTDAAPEALNSGDSIRLSVTYEAA